MKTVEAIEKVLSQIVNEQADDALLNNDVRYLLEDLLSLALSDQAELEKVKGEASAMFEKGFHDGYIAGQKEGLKLAAQAINTNPKQTINIRCRTVKQAKELLDGLSSSLLVMDEMPQPPIGKEE